MSTPTTNRTFFAAFTDDSENIVAAAIDAGLVGPMERSKLLEGIPMGFVYSLPTVSRPIDQLRFDLMELGRTPRLIGLDRPPLLVWLENAVGRALDREATGAAEVLARAADALRGGTANRERVAQSKAPPADPEHSAKARAVAAVEAARVALDAAVSHLSDIVTMSGNAPRQADPGTEGGK